MVKVAIGKTRSIDWERDALGNSAIFVAPDNMASILRSTADELIRSLMHELTVVSATFPVHDVVVFSRTAGVSVFGKESAVFYGLYSSSRVSDEPGYCLRRSVWERNGSKSIDAALKGLSSQTHFFHLHSLREEQRKVIESLNCISIEECETLNSPTENAGFADKGICYFVADQFQSSLCRYRGRSANNLYIENLFQGFELIFGALNVANTEQSISGSLRVSYSCEQLLNVIG